MTENFDKDTQKNKGIIQLINNSSEIASSAVVGTAAGLLSGDPITGFVIGVGSKGLELTFRWIGNELSERMIGPREKVRAGAVAAFAVADIHKRLESGENLRDDGFFNKKDADRSEADEILESVVLKAQREPEEKKIQYMGYLYSNIAFNSQIDVHTAHKFVNIAEELTYRQLCIIKLASKSESFDVHNLEQTNLTMTFRSVLQDCLDLYDMGCIDGSNPLIKRIIELYFSTPGDALWSSSGKEAKYPDVVDTKNNRVREFGKYIFELMKLDLIPDDDVNEIVKVFK